MPYGVIQFVLTEKSRTKLLKEYHPAHPVVAGNHITLGNFICEEDDDEDIYHICDEDKLKYKDGQELTVHTVGHALTGKHFAVVVKGIDAAFKIPYIVISHMSNQCVEDVEQIFEDGKKGRWDKKRPYTKDLGYRSVKLKGRVRYIVMQ